MQLSTDYYMVRRNPDPFKPYWGGVTTDPDGVLRHRDSEAERQRYLADVAAELEFARSVPSGDILDVGAGLGWFLSALIPLGERYAIEPDLYARSRLRAQSIDLVDDIENTRPLRYGLVICHHVIEHCPDPSRVLFGIHRTLRPGGWLIFATPDFDSPCAQRFGDNYRMLRDQTHVSLFTRSSADRFLVDYGFVIRDVQYPFPDRYATAENFARWNDTSNVSPPWPGNWMTFYAQRG